MKTQIITLASHDDLISVRDRMSWAKAPRILLVWPLYEQIPLRPLDLRILQQHAAQLGAQMGLVTHHLEIKRDAESFGIPVFRSTADAQRGKWSRGQTVGLRRLRRSGNRLAELRAMSDQIRRGGEHWSSQSGARIGFFALAVLAVFSIASLYLPRAVIVLTPVTIEQSATVNVEARGEGASGILTGWVPTRSIKVTSSASQTMQVQSRSEIPKEKATGTVRFQNLSQVPIVIPSGTVVYSVTPSTVRFVTLLESQVEGKVNASVEIPIEALEAGSVGNLPANAIQSVEGGLGASMTVTNPAPTAGGTNAWEPVPSQSDRDRLRGDLLKELETKAHTQLIALLKAGDVILPETLTLASIERESFDPPASQQGSVLTLAISATYEATYVRGEDLRGLAELTLNASIPQGYMARADTLQVSLTSATATDGDSKPRYNVEASRTVMRAIDPAVVNLLCRGQMPRQALGKLQAELPLAAAPEIRITPAWWPWLPLIPFQISVVIE
jgi:hypothetical protein